jgi:transposase
MEESHGALARGTRNDPSTMVDRRFTVVDDKPPLVFAEAVRVAAMTAAGGANPINFVRRFFLFRRRQREDDAFQTDGTQVGRLEGYHRRRRHDIHQTAILDDVFSAILV